MFDGIFQNYTLFLFVFIRLSGAILFNPLLGRRNVPVHIRVGLSFLCALLVTGTLGSIDVATRDLLTFVLSGLKELVVGLASGFVMNLLLAVAIVAGELMDLQLGVSMSKIYDPQANVSMPLLGTLLNLLLTLTFFLSNGHLTLIRIVALSFRVLPPGSAMLGSGFAQYLVLLFAEILVMAVKIALPVIAMETVAEVGMGVLMRTVPQINVFVVGIQLRAILGLAVILPMVPFLARAMDFMVGYMFDKLQYVFQLMA